MAMSISRRDFNGFVVSGAVTLGLGVGRLFAKAPEIGDVEYMESDRGGRRAARRTIVDRVEPAILPRLARCDQSRSNESGVQAPASMRARRSPAAPYPGISIRASSSASGSSANARSAMRGCGTPSPGWRIVWFP